jgi:sirohydrochlorin ferrochelatase
LAYFINFCLDLNRDFIISKVFHHDYLLMTRSSAYLLLAHGSRDARTTTALTQLADACIDKLAICRTRLGTAYLELADLPIEDQTHQFALQALQQGCQQIKILPLFLTPGVHVTKDLPAVVAVAQKRLSQRCQLQLLPYLGASAGIMQILQDYCQQLPTPQIFLAHGSRQPAAAEFLSTMAAQLAARPAYWSSQPQLLEQAQHLAAQQPSAIGILQYFLFPGRTSSAITAAINELQFLFPNIEFKSTALLGTDPRLIDLLVELLLGNNV